MSAPGTANYWPTEQQALILRAALSPPEPAMTAWLSLRGRLDLDSIDLASQRLLPLLERNLTRLGIEDPVLVRCKGIHRYHWSRNQVLFHRGGALLAALAAAGVETLLLKGAALVTRYYGDPGLRPMNDFDVAVPAAAAVEAVAVLERSGWSSVYRITPSFRRVKHAALFEDQGRRHCDLHWRILEESPQAAADEDLWSASDAIEFQGQRTRILSPADQLLHVCVHGARWAPEAGIRWIADAMLIIAAGGIDWRRLVDGAGTRRFVLRMRETLEFLRTAMAAPIPDTVVADLRARPETRLERLERRILSREHRLLGGLPLYWCHHVRGHDGVPLPTAAATFPRYLQHTWGLEALREVPRGALARAARRLFRQPGAGVQ
jgi:Uncharacterised nucleotidyltransferase